MEAQKSSQHNVLLGSHVIHAVNLYQAQKSTHKVKHAESINLPIFCKTSFSGSLLLSHVFFNFCKYFIMLPQEGKKKKEIMQTSNVGHIHHFKKTELNI